MVKVQPPRRLLACVAASALAAGSAGGGHPGQASADTTGTGSATGSSAPATVAQIVATAQRYVGSPYASMGDEPATGFSCIGFAHFVFAQNGVYVPEDLNKAYAAAPHVDQTDLQAGDLVFFQNTVWQGLSHVALYIGNGQMIAADSYQTGVEVDNLSDPYWQAHYLGATRPLADPSGTPGVPSSTPASGPSGPTLAPPSGPRLNVPAGTMLTPTHTATIYSGPGARYTAIDTVTPAISVTVVQTQGQWVNVSYNADSQYGWLRGSDLSLPTPPSSAAGNGTGQSATSRGGGTTTGSAAPPGSPAVRHAPRARTGGPGRPHHGRTHAAGHDGRPAVVRGGPNRHARILRRVHAGDHLRLLTTSGDRDDVVLRDDARGWVTAHWVVDAPQS